MFTSNGFPGLIPYSMNIPSEILIRFFYLATGFVNANPILWLLLANSYVPFGLYLLF